MWRFSAFERRRSFGKMLFFFFFFVPRPWGFLGRVWFERE